MQRTNIIPRDNIASKMLIQTALEKDMIYMEMLIQNALIRDKHAGTWRITIERLDE